MSETFPQLLLAKAAEFGDSRTALREKYHGGSARVENLVKEFANIAASKDCIYIDTNSKLLDDFEKLNRDWIHLNPEGQKIVAETLDKALNKFFEQ